MGFFMKLDFYDHSLITERVEEMIEILNDAF
ncbi:MAG: hypothetical protein RIT43_1288 [Bacteroidota bacterium]|jgi:hypothetical protein